MLTIVQPAAVIIAGKPYLSAIKMRRRATIEDFTNKTGLRAICLVATLMLSAIWPAYGFAATGNTIIAFAARIAGDANRTRLVIDFDQKTKYKTLFLENPNRLIIDLPDTVFSFDKKQKQALHGLITGFRYGAIAPGRARIVLQTGSPARLDSSSLQPHGENGHHRLLLDLVKTNAESYRNAIFLQSDTFGKSGDVAYKGDRIQRKRSKSNKITIVIDPGHGGIDGGAEGKKAGAEKNITLRFAQKLKHELEKSSQIRVILTRNEDIFVSLNERVGIARRNHAALMISLHADTLKQKHIRGATIYTLSKEGSDELAKYLADKENRSDLVAGLALPQQNAEVADILIELTRRETKVFSLQIARALVSQLKTRIRLIKNPLRAANFHVLRAPEVPSVLIELGYLSNSTDEQQLNSNQWQQTTAEQVKIAIMNYLRPKIAQRGN